MMLSTFHLIVNILLLISAIFVFFSENTVHSIIFLVLTFLNAANICFIFGSDFLGLVLIIIYVGAIAILFLFVVMLLNVKTHLLGVLRYLPLIIIFGFFIFNQLYLIISDFYLNFNFLEAKYYFYESLTNEFFLSQVLYNYFLICILLSGLILLVGMIGAIVLTLKLSRDKRKEISYRQLSRSTNLVENCFSCIN